LKDEEAMPLKEHEDDEGFRPMLGEPESNIHHHISHGDGAIDDDHDAFQF
jgi:hypothetical protein